MFLESHSGMLKLIWKYDQIENRKGIKASFINVLTGDLFILGSEEGEILMMNTKLKVIWVLPSLKGSVKFFKSLS